MLMTGNDLEHFRTEEIRKLKRLMIVLIVLPFLINFSIIVPFINIDYNYYKAHQFVWHPDRSYLFYSGPTIILIQTILFSLILPYLLIVYNSFKATIAGISALNNKYLAVYIEYTKAFKRFYVTLPQYIISQEGLIVVKIFKKIILPSHSIDKIIIRSVPTVKMSYQCYVQFYLEDKFITTLMYYSLTPHPVDFLISNIELLNKEIKIEYSY